MSADGKIALPSRKQIRLSNIQDSERVNQLREECDAILVGIGTILEDNPKLTVKGNNYLKRNPTRIILDTNGRTPLESNVLDTNARTIVAVGNECKVAKLKEAEIIKCGGGKINIKLLIKKLSERGMKKILVEGGETVLWSFLSEKLFDTLKIFVASTIIGGENTPTMAGGIGFATKMDTLEISLDCVQKLGNGVLLTYHKI